MCEHCKNKSHSPLPEGVIFGIEPVVLTVEDTSNQRRPFVPLAGLIEEGQTYALLVEITDEEDPRLPRDSAPVIIVRLDPDDPHNLHAVNNESARHLMPIFAAALGVDIRPLTVEMKTHAE